jgi:hypothetical protein
MPTTCMLLDPPQVHLPDSVLAACACICMQLVYHDAPSKCESECRTIAKACEEVLSTTHPPPVFTKPTSFLNGR